MTKYRFEHDGKSHIAYVEPSGNNWKLTVWCDEELVKEIFVVGTEPDDGTVAEVLSEELDDKHIVLDTWLTFTVQYDYTSCVSVSFECFEGDEDSIASNLLETSYKDDLVEQFKDELEWDPCFECGWAEAGDCGAMHIYPEDLKSYMKEV